MKHSTAVLLVAALMTGGACSDREPPPAPVSPADTTPRPLTVNSDTLDVKGEYAAVELDQVNGLAVEDGKLVIRGGSSAVQLEPPASADVTKPSRRWVLVTEADVDDKRLLVFTHEESLDDFTVELPAMEAPVRFGVFERTSGGEVLVLAWGAGSRSYWGYVTIARRPGSQR